MLFRRSKKADAGKTPVSEDGILTFCPSKIGAGTGFLTGSGDNVFWMEYELENGTKVRMVMTEADMATVRKVLEELDGNRKSH